MSSKLKYDLTWYRFVKNRFRDLRKVNDGNEYMYTSYQARALIAQEISVKFGIGYMSKDERMSIVGHCLSTNIPRAISSSLADHGQLTLPFN